jgi:hypothetical protein
MTEVREKLTPAGESYARRVILWRGGAGPSIVAAVALQGYGTGWPADFVSAAIRACNAEGDGKDE